jgi:hypothetical protein
MSPDGILHEGKIEYEKSRTQIFSSIPSRCVSLDYNLPSVTPTREGSHLTSTFLTNPSSSSFLSPTLSVPLYQVTITTNGPPAIDTALNSKSEHKLSPAGKAQASQSTTRIRV